MSLQKPITVVGSNLLHRGCRILLVACGIGFTLNLFLYLLPARFKPVHAWRRTADWHELMEYKSWQIGLGPSGYEAGHFVTQWKADDRNTLDIIRSQWRQRLSQPQPVRTVETKLLEWDEWGPNCTFATEGVMQIDRGGYASVPYSMAAVLCLLPIAIWGMARVRRRLQR